LFLLSREGLKKLKIVVDEFVDAIEETGGVGFGGKLYGDRLMYAAGTSVNWNWGGFSLDSARA
jgi:hypothetical protein